MLRYINLERENMKHWKLGVIAALMSGAIYAAPMNVVTSFSILGDVTKQIGGDRVAVQNLVGANQDTHAYHMTSGDIKKIRGAKLVLLNGLGLEAADVQRAVKQSKVPFAEAAKGIQALKAEEGEHHHDHEGHHHDHGEFDPHIWLDPVLVKIQAKNIAAALSEKYPENKALFEANLAKFEAQLDELDGFIKSTLANVKNREFIVYHPSWGYFAKRYDLEQIAIEVDGKEPKPAELKELIEEAKEHGVKVIFVAPQFSKKAAQTVAKESGASVVEIDQLPLDWDAELRKTAQIFAKSL